MSKHRFTRVVPRASADLAPEPIIDFSSGYVLRALDRLPRQGHVVPWKLYQNYIRDLWTIRRSPLPDPALELSA
jgi:hypothetical protein